MSVKDVEIITGTYEEFLLGYTLENVDNKCRLVQSFANHSHTASIRCVTLNGTVLASGGADETVHLYDLNTRRESGLLMHHNGTVNCLAFSPDGCYLMSGGNDGKLAMHNTVNWTLEKEWGAAHKGSGVLTMSIHPSGKLALSVGANGTLCTWNLIKGRRAYTTRLTSSKLGEGLQISSILWSPCGQFYSVAIASRVDIYKVDSASVEYSISAEKKVNCQTFLNERVLCLGCDEGKIELHDILEQKPLSVIQAHEERVKCVASVLLEGTIYVASGSSGGEIKLWKLKGQKLIERCGANTGCRITSITIATCGILNPTKQEEEDDKTGVQSFIPQREDTRRGVVVVELDGDDDSDLDGKAEGDSKEVRSSGERKQQKKKKKKKKKLLNQSKNGVGGLDENADDGDERTMKNNHNDLNNTGKTKQLKQQKKKKKKKLNQTENCIRGVVSQTKSLKRKLTDRTGDSVKVKKRDGAWVVTKAKT